MLSAAPAALPASTPAMSDLPQSGQDTEPSIRIAVVKPTSVHNKAALFAAMKVHVLFLSETSAVRKVQLQTQHALGARGFQSVWGDPVAAHVSPRTGQDTLRGHASGVAIASSLPLHLPCVPLAPAALSSTRLVEGSLRLGHMQLRLICVYGFPSSYVDHRSRNQHLLELAIDRISLSRVPTLLGGDFNAAVQELPVWQQLLQLGYAELFQFYNARFGHQLPATCRGATRYDTLLLPPALQAMLVSARVDTESKQFDTHDPLIVSFSSSAAPCLYTWKMPQAWTVFSPDMDYANDYYNRVYSHLGTTIKSCATAAELDSSFLQWAEAIEDSVYAAIRWQHKHDPLQQPFTCLPTKARGRCRQRVRTPCLQPHAARNGRKGDYCPLLEAASVSSRRKVRQVRRLQTLHRGVLALTSREGTPALALRRQLLGEWQAARRSRAFGAPFEHWILGFEPFHHVWLDLPSALWLQDVVSVAKQACDAQIQAESKLRRDGSGMKQGFRNLRPQPAPPVTCLPVKETRQAVRYGPPAGRCALYEVSHPQFFRTHALAHSTCGTVWVLEILLDTEGDRPDLLRLEFCDCDAPASCTIFQTTQAVTSAELHREFLDFWRDTWWRDNPQAARDVTCWPDFLRNLPAAPACTGSDSVDLSDTALWASAVARLKPGRATGYDGFSPAELKGLRGRSLEHLALLFDTSASTGFPEHLAQSRVSALAKRDPPQTFADIRPITVFGATYRLWSSVLARGLLRAWSRWLPFSVSGELPHRSVRDISYHIQASVELAISDKTPLGGFSVDLVRCFNHLPQAPVACLLKHLGVKPRYVDLWLQFLHRAQRCATLGGSLCSPFGASTGLPQSDAMAVVGITALCWVLVSLSSSAHARALTFIDNFTWLSATARGLQESLVDAQRFCASIKVPIEWRKSFCWATCPVLKRWWDRTACQFLPSGVTLQRVDTAKDLGVLYQFRCKASKAKGESRFQEGRERIERLRREPRPVESKARLLTVGIWPQAFYGAHPSGD